MRCFAKLVFGLALLAALFWRLNLHAIVDALARYRWPYLLAAVAMLLLSVPIAALRWKVFASRIPLQALLELTMIGQFYSMVLPGQIAGEFVKAYRIGSGNAEAERLATSVFVDRVVGLVALLFVAGVGLLLSPHQLPRALAWALTGLLLLLLASLFAFRIRALHAFALRGARYAAHTRLQPLTTGLERAIDAWRDFSHSSGRLLLSLMLGIVFQVLAIGIYAVLGTNLGIALGPADWAWVVAVASVAVLLPLSVGGLGLREGALIGCLGFLGVTAERALALSLGIFTLALAGAAMGGLLELVEIARRRPPRVR